AGRRPAAVWLNRGLVPKSGSRSRNADRGSPSVDDERRPQMIIGIDPHKSSHTATAVDAATNTPVASLRIEASLAGYRKLLRWSEQFDDRHWAVENARGLGRHLAQWLV